MPSASSRRLTITLAGMRFHVRVGVLPHERDLVQPLEIDLSVRQRAGPGALLDYRALYALASDAVRTGPIDYLETVADAIATAALALPGVASVRVAVRKPHVALGGPLSHAEVVVELEP